MDDFFATDGPLFTFLGKAGQVILASLFAIICMIPVVTIIPALSALYYGTIKTVRRDRSYISKEYFRSFKHCLKKGILFTLMYLGLGAILIFNINIVWTSNLSFLAIYGILLLLLIMSVVYLIPVLSRFDMPAKDMLKLSLVMSIRHLPTTFITVVGTLLVIFVQLAYLPVVTILFVPGVWCYLTTFLMERILKKYMAKVFSSESGTSQDEDDKDTWYLE